MSLFSTLALSLLISLFFVNQFTTIEGLTFKNREIHLKITNALKSREQITIHCKSGDDDLGVHNLTAWTDFDFKFRPNFWETTLFYCSFQLPDAFHYFDIYVDKRDRKKCNLTECLWLVMEQYMCMFNYLTQKYDFCYEWSPKKSIYL